MTEQMIWVSMIPPTVTAQEHKVAIVNGKPRFYDPPELKAAKQKLEAHIAKYAPEEPYTGPLKLHVKWCFPAGQHEHGTYRDTKPDTDNLQKALKDVMTKLHFWNDDAQVACEISEKFWSERPGLYISIGRC